jgi:hypothetical protein
VAPAWLHIAVQKMAVDRVEDDLRNLRAVGVIEDEGGLLMERGKQATGRDRTERRRLGMRLTPANSYFYDPELSVFPPSC